MHQRLLGLFGLNKAFQSSTRAQPAQAAASPRSLNWTAPCGTALSLRPVRTSDAALLGEFFDEGLSAQARSSRFHGAVGRLSAARLAWMADADFQHHAAFVVTRWDDGLEHVVAEGRWVRTAIAPGAEFALSVSDHWQGRGIGQRLLQALVRCGREQGLPCLVGDVLPGNEDMLSLARSLGFVCQSHPEDGALMRAELELGAPKQRRVNAFSAFTTAAWQL